MDFDIEDNMCNMEGYEDYENMEDYEDYENMEDLEEYDAKSIASTIDDFVERTPTNRIGIFREKIIEMQKSWIGTLFLLILIFSLALSLFYWDETKNIIYTYFGKINSTVGVFV